MKIAIENSDPKEPYSALNLFSSGKHNSHSKQEKPHEKPSKKRFSHDKQEQLSNGEHEFVKSMCIFCRRNHKTKFCDLITKLEILKEILFKERRCFICIKRGHSAKQRRNTMKYFKCSGHSHVAVSNFQNRDSSNHLQAQEDHSTTSNLINIPKNDSIFLQTEWAKVSLVDETVKILEYYLITNPSCRISAHRLLKI